MALLFIHGFKLGHDLFKLLFFFFEQLHKLFWINGLIAVLISLKDLENDPFFYQTIQRIVDVSAVYTGSRSYLANRELAL